MVESCGLPLFHRNWKHFLDSSIEVERLEALNHRHVVNIVQYSSLDKTRSFPFLSTIWYTSPDMLRVGQEWIGLS